MITLTAISGCLYVEVFMKTRKIVSICNMIIAFLCTVSIFAYFLMPFWQVKIGYTINADTIQTMLGDDSNAEDEEDESEASPEDVLGNIDFADIVGEEGITINLGITLETVDILKSLSDDPTTLVHRILTKNINDIVDQLEGTLNNIVQNVMKVVTKTAAAEILKSEIQHSMSGNATEADVKEEMNKAGLTDEYIDQKTSEFVDMLYSESTTPEKAADETIGIIEDALEKMKETNNPDFKDLKLDEDTKEELRDNLLEVFENFATEDGTLDLNLFASGFLTMLFPEGESSENPMDGDEEEPFDQQSSRLSPRNYTLMGDSETDDSETGDSDVPDLTVTDLRQMLADTLMEQLEGSINGIATAISAISYVILFTLAMWLLPIVKILLKMNKRNNSVKVGSAIWFGSSISIIWWLPTLIFNALSNPALTEASAALGALSGLSLSVTSCTSVTFFISVFLALFVMFFYAGKRRALRRECKNQPVAPATIVVTPAPATEAAVATQPTEISDNANENIDEEFHTDSYNIPIK